jgi:uncharacterized membrane protein (UPF0127 family)
MIFITMELLINNNSFTVKTMITPKDIQNGMMGKKFDNQFNGMLFILTDGEHSFWMKDCIVNLDIIFINNNTITKIHKNCKPCKGNNCLRYKGFGDMVLEIKGGSSDLYDIQENDIVVIND